MHSPQGVRGRTEQLTAVARPQVESRLATARSEFAARFDAVLRRHAELGNVAMSNGAIARRLGVTEKIIRQWRSGDKPMPAAALCVFAPTLQAEVIAIARGVEPTAPRSTAVARSLALQPRVAAAIARSKELIASRGHKS